MASTTIYTDGIVVNQQGTGTYGPFRLMGGLYGVQVVGTGGWTIQSVTGPDGTTPVNMAAAISATGYSTLYLPPGAYQVVNAGAASSISVQRIKLG